MTYNEKKSLYESIMKEVSKTVKRYINESSSYYEVPSNPRMCALLFYKFIEECVTHKYFIANDNYPKDKFAKKVEEGQK